MNVKIHQPQCTKSALLLGMVMAVSVVLVGCGHQPKSLFEQQAEAESANEIETRTHGGEQVAIVTPATADNASITPIHLIKNQTIAQQPNCDTALRDCQYLELNVLDFNPEQPWLTSIMWQTIARMLAPETPLASQDETAKKTVSMLFNQIEYAEQAVDTLPLYQRIDTTLVLNPVSTKKTTSQPLNKQTMSTPNSGKAETYVPITTGYLLIRSNQHRDRPHQQRLNYVMLDMQKTLNLSKQLLPL